jgi:hypothetical protein
MLRRARLGDPAAPLPQKLADCLAAAIDADPVRWARMFRLSKATD